MFMMVVRFRPPNASQYALRMYEQRVTCWLKSKKRDGADRVSDLPKEKCTFCYDRRLPGKTKCYEKAEAYLRRNRAITALWSDPV